MNQPGAAYKRKKIPKGVVAHLKFEGLSIDEKRFSKTSSSQYSQPEQPIVHPFAIWRHSYVESMPVAVFLSVTSAPGGKLPTSPSLDCGQIPLPVGGDLLVHIWR